LPGNWKTPILRRTGVIHQDRKNSKEEHSEKRNQTTLSHLASLLLKNIEEKRAGEEPFWEKLRKREDGAGGNKYHQQRQAVCPRPMVEGPRKDEANTRLQKRHKELTADLKSYAAEVDSAKKGEETKKKRGKEKRLEGKQGRTKTTPGTARNDLEKNLKNNVVKRTLRPVGIFHLNTNLTKEKRRKSKHEAGKPRT